MSNQNKDIYFITGGGTGGHIYPAVSVISALKEAGVENENIFYLGNEKNLEYEIAKKNGYNFLSYTVKGMPRKQWSMFLNISQMSFLLQGAMFALLFFFAQYFLKSLMFCMNQISNPG